MKPCSVTEDHKPDLPSEQKRIERMGGRVWAMTYDDGVDGPPRVWLKDQELPGLAMSRSIGDEVAKRAGVISNPEIFEYKHRNKQHFYAWPPTVYGSSCLMMMLSTSRTGKWKRKKAIETLMKESERRWKNEEPVVETPQLSSHIFKNEQTWQRRRRT